MFENFPYTDMHQLNLDWIVKIAKDFLEQYTQIQETINTGLEDLDNKATELQALLDEWYNTHSQDIANQLADALQDLNDWYNTHQAFLDEYVTSSIQSFRQQAETIGQEVIDSIPDDYTELSELAEETADNTDDVIMGLANCMVRNLINPDKMEEGYYSHSDPSYIGHSGNTKYIPPVRIRKGLTYSFLQIYGYFTLIKYDDDTVVALANNPSPASINYGLTATKNGYAYITINNDHYDTAMVVEGMQIYSGAHFNGYGSILSVYPVNAITPSNYAANLPKLEEARANTIYKIISTSAMTVSGTMTDVPDVLKDGSQHVSTLINIGFTTSIPGTQLLVVDTGELYRRHVSNENPRTFTAWNSYTREMFKGIKQVVSPSNYATFLPSLDNTALAGSVYTFISTKNMTTKYGGLWASVPPEMEKHQCIGTIATYGLAGQIGCSQVIYLTNIGKIYMRYLNDTGSGAVWTSWVSTNNEIHIAKDGSGDFSTLTEGVNFATSIPNCHVIVHEGVYDIIEEYSALYGSNFFLNYSASETNVGLVLSNNIVLECCPNVYIKCEYTGSNQNVQNKFSAFNSGPNGFTLMNANIITKKIRYAIHDERSSATDYYHNIYLNCNINHDQAGGAGYIQCIGGGLGKNGLIDIENCIFANPNSTGQIVSWHNARVAGAKSKINIKNSLIKGTIRFSYWGESTLLSTMIVTGCKMFTNAVVTQETQEYSTVNVEILQWNNTTGSF